MEWAKKSNQKTLLGQLLVDKKLISQEQLDWAIEQQKKTGQRLGDVVTELNLISRKQVDAVLRKQRTMRLAASVVTALLGPIPCLCIRSYGACGTHGNPKCPQHPEGWWAACHVGQGNVRDDGSGGSGRHAG
ncbi:MAG: hypothetical protein IPL16_12785 [Ignavibacteria bacterium]|nr:hypothetical protein [Ignavibacteria bacterium]